MFNRDSKRRKHKRLLPKQIESKESLKPHNKTETIAWITESQSLNHTVNEPHMRTMLHCSAHTTKRINILNYLNYYYLNWNKVEEFYILNTPHPHLPINIHSLYKCVWGSSVMVLSRGSPIRREWHPTEQGVAWLYGDSTKYSSLNTQQTVKSDLFGMLCFHMCVLLLLLLFMSVQALFFLFFFFITLDYREQNGCVDFLYTPIWIYVGMCVIYTPPQKALMFVLSLPCL